MFLRIMVILYSLGCAAYFSTIRSICIFVPIPAAWFVLSRYLDRMPSTRVEFQWSSCVLLSVYFGLILWWMVPVGIAASPEPWGAFDTSVSPVGKSPCCRSADGDTQPCVYGGVRAPYHPIGFFVYGKDTPSLTNSPAVTTCPVGRWADSNGINPTGHNRNPSNGAVGAACLTGQPCDGLASKDAGDYPDLGRGLRDGWSIDAVIAPAVLCPGVARTTNAAGIVGQGLDICSQCGYPRPAHCKDYSNSQLLCFMCPSGFFSSEPGVMPYRQMRFMIELLFGQYLFMMLATSTAISRCSGKTQTKYPKSYSEIF